MMKRLQTNIDTKYAITVTRTEMYGDILIDIHIHRLPKIENITYVLTRGEADIVDIVDNLLNYIGCIVSIENHGEGFVDCDGNLYYFEEVQDAPRV